MGRKVNWGIIAAGGIARRRTLPAMKDVPNAVITGIMDKNQKVLDEISEEYKITDTYTEEQEQSADRSRLCCEPSMFSQETGSGGTACGKKPSS